MNWCDWIRNCWPIISRVAARLWAVAGYPADDWQGQPLVANAQRNRPSSQFGAAVGGPHRYKEEVGAAVGARDDGGGDGSFGEPLMATVDDMRQVLVLAGSLARQHIVERGKGIRVRCGLNADGVPTRAWHYRGRRLLAPFLELNSPTAFLLVLGAGWPCQPLAPGGRTS